MVEHSFLRLIPIPLCSNNNISLHAYCEQDCSWCHQADSHERNRPRLLFLLACILLGGEEKQVERAERQT